MTAPALALLAALGSGEGATRYDPAAVAALDAMEKAAAATRDYTMRLVKRELRGTQLLPEETIYIKWQRPQRIYLKEIAGPREGQEVLYVPGTNKNRIKVHKGLTLNLNPYGATAMSKSHHPVPEVSLVRLVDRILDNARRAQQKSHGKIVYAGPEALFGRTVVKVEATFPATGKTPTIEKGETLWDVSRATGQSMYVILHANRRRLWWQADHPEKGDAVFVPDYYAGRMVLWIDTQLNLPLKVILYDHEGTLYEQYEHHDLKVNVGLKDADFDSKNPAYGF